jgi:hypothetical protein
MADLKEQHVCITVFFKLGRNVTETSETLKVCFGWQPMGKTKFLSGLPNSKAV